MPDVAADTGQGVLAAWLVEESARFDAAETIAYVETQDELFSVEAGRPGVLLKTLVEPGTTVEPGTPIGILGEPSERVDDLAAVLAELGVAGRKRVGAAALLDATVSGHRGDPAPRNPFPAPEPLSALAVVSPVEDAPAGPEPQHQYLRARVPVDRLVGLSARLERDRPDSSVDDLVGRAVLAAHRQVPQLGVARLAQDTSATPGIPVTYPGRFGVGEAAAVVPPGEAAALAVGDVRDEPVIDSGAVVPGKVMVLTLSMAPGRVGDVVASRWLAVLVALLERPEWMVE
jgi:pyruvate/2-oxoglutarate dehydrogenase complex dihydrolipoamide acyltransferase (E2) component